MGAVRSGDDVPKVMIMIMLMIKIMMMIKIMLMIKIMMSLC